MSEGKKLLLAIALLVVVFVALCAWLHSRASACEHRRCDHGSPVFLARDGQCICAEVPR